MTALRRRMMEEMEIRNFSPNTIRVYIFHVAQFAKHFGKSPDLLGPEEVRKYQVFLLREKKTALSTINQKIAALRFFYKETLGQNWVIDRLRYPRRPDPARGGTVVLSKQEVFGLLAAVRNLKHRTVLMTLYATGMRVSELTRLQVDDIDSKRMVIRVHQGKGKKDRYLPLLPSLLTMLRVYWKKYHPKGALFPSHYSSKWVAYTKPPWGGAKQVLNDLARYTHRVAISNQRLLSLEDGKVRFRWKDYRNGHKPRTMTLDAVEFLRRFLLHVLPKGFMRIRYYGFLANPACSGQGEGRPLSEATGSSREAKHLCTRNVRRRKQRIGG